MTWYLISLKILTSLTKPLFFNGIKDRTKNLLSDQQEVANMPFSVLKIIWFLHLKIVHQAMELVSQFQKDQKKIINFGNLHQLIILKSRIKKVTIQKAFQERYLIFVNKNVKISNLLFNGLIMAILIKFGLFNLSDFLLSYLLQSKTNFFPEFKKMGWGVNEKVLAKKQKDKEKKDTEKLVEHEKKQSSKWKDQVTDKKAQQKRKEEQKRIKQLQKKQQLKQLLAKEQQQMEKISKKKQLFETKKLTQAEILLNQQRKLAQKQKGQSSGSQDEDNPNLATHDFEVAQNVQQALNALNLKEDKHPEKRMKAAFEQFCDKREPTMKLQNPTLKRTQRMQLLRKEFDKHPDNPMNKANKAYNEK